jgi:hypothetical protein
MTGFVKYYDTQHFLYSNMSKITSIEIDKKFNIMI